jgi:hypothetical protein
MSGWRRDPQPRPHEGTTWVIMQVIQGPPGLRLMHRLQLIWVIMQVIQGPPGPTPWRP